MSLAPVFSSITIMAVMIAIGVIMAQRMIITSNAKQLLISIVINVAMPCIILNGIFHSDMTGGLLSSLGVVFIFSIFINCFGILLGWIGANILGYRSLRARQVAILAGLGNTGFIGIPLCANLLGPTGGLLAALFDAGLDITIFTVAVFCLQNQPNFSFRQLKALISIPIFSIVIGMIAAVVGLQPPLIVKELTSSLSALAAPLAMLYIGMLIPPIFKKNYKIPLKNIGVPMIMKLVILPSLTLLLLVQFMLSAEVKQVIFIQAAMPTITLASVLFARYTKDEEWAAVATVASTLFAMATIPVIIFIGNGTL